MKESSPLRAVEKGEVTLPARLAQEQQRQFTCVVVAPHGALAVGNPLAGRNVVPTVRPVINRVKQQTLVFGAGREIRFGEERVGDRQATLPITRAVLRVLFGQQIIPQPPETLPGD